MAMYPPPIPVISQPSTISLLVPEPDAIVFHPKNTFPNPVVVVSPEPLPIEVFL